MRMLANLLCVACWLGLPMLAWAQTAGPIKHPAGADPFGGGNTKRPAVKQPIVRDVTRPNAAAHQAKNIAGGESPQPTEQIRAALKDLTTQTFIQTPLVDAVVQLSQTHDIPIIIDKRALEEIGLSVDTPVTLDLKNVSLRSFLRLMLHDLDLTYLVKDEVMQITTVEAAEQNLVVEMHRFAEGLTGKADKIVQALTASVVPACWDVNGGPCSVTAIDHVLVVSAPETIHEDVIDFLKKLQQAFEPRESKR